MNSSSNSKPEGPAATHLGHKIGPGWPETSAQNLGSRRLTMEPPPRYVQAMVNVTNHCNLSCAHCFVFRDGNPNNPANEMKAAPLLEELERLRDRHGIRSMIWMGGEPMLRWRVIKEGLHLFQRNTITTNGTIPLHDFGPDVTYVISLDGPPQVNDSVRGQGVFDKVMLNLSKISEDFQSTVMSQCVLHRQNQHELEELVIALQPTRIEGLTFSFYVPRAGENSNRCWEDNRAREDAIEIVLSLKAKYPGFIWNSTRSLELLRSPICDEVTRHCPLQQTLLPLYMEAGYLSTPFCCYGNDVDCQRCGSWGVFATAAKAGGPWEEKAGH